MSSSPSAIQFRSRREICDELHISLREFSRRYGSHFRRKRLFSPSDYEKVIKLVMQPNTAE